VHEAVVTHHRVTVGPVDGAVHRRAGREVPPDAVPDHAGLVLADLGDRERLAADGERALVGRLPAATWEEVSGVERSPSRVARLHPPVECGAVGILEV
jgi:hypothetical protein